MKKSVKTILVILFAASITPPLFMLLRDLISGGTVPELRDFFINIAYSVGPTVSLTAGCTLAISVLSKKLPWNEKALARLVTELLVIIVLALGVAFLFTYANSMANGNANFKRLFSTNIFFNLFITLLVVAFLEASFFFRQWKQSLLESERLQKEHFKAQFQNLKNQVNPHLLFNSLNALTGLIEKDAAKAVEYVQDLSKYLRLVLNQSNEEAIELRAELALLHHYYQLQRARFRDAFVLQVEIPDDVQGELIPPLVLQMLVENAVKHNVMSRSQPLVVQVRWSEGFLNVANKKVPKPSDERSTGVGLDNIASRYSLLGGRVIDIFDGPTEFRVQVPLLTIEDHARTHH